MTYLNSNYELEKYHKYLLNIFYLNNSAFFRRKNHIFSFTVFTLSSLSTLPPGVAPLSYATEFDHSLDLATFGVKLPMYAFMA
jgi:hypothetical protein